MPTRTHHFLTVMAANKDLTEHFSKFSESGWRMATGLVVVNFMYYKVGYNAKSVLLQGLVDGKLRIAAHARGAARS